MPRFDDMLRSLPFLTLSVYSFSLIFHSVLIPSVGKCCVFSFFAVLSDIHLAMLWLCMFVCVYAKFWTLRTLTDVSYVRAERFFIDFNFNNYGHNVFLPKLCSFNSL